jgi:hypothetical protein
MFTWAADLEDAACDGSLCDLCVFATSAEDWTSVLMGLERSGFAYEYRRGGSAMPLPTRVDLAFPEPGECDRLLVVRLGGMSFHCHFFDLDEVVFDLDPREIAGESSLQAIVVFMQFLAATTGKDCALTPEGGHATPILTMSPRGEATGRVSTASDARGR